MTQSVEANGHDLWISAAAACGRAARLARRSLAIPYAGVFSIASERLALIGADAEDDTSHEWDLRCRDELLRGGDPASSGFSPDPGGRLCEARPIVLAGQTVGAICAVRRATNDWSDRDEEILALLAADLADHLVWAAERKHADAARNDTLANLAVALHDHLRAVATFSDVMRRGTEPDSWSASLFMAEFDRLATSEAAMVSDPRPEEAGETASPATRILLADDLDLNRKLISDMLSIEGHVVDCVEDGGAAVAALTLRRYDLVLMDVVMPGMDGLSATRAIRALPLPASSVPIVALTANAFGEQLKDCIEAGMDATLVKPMSLEALSVAVQTWTRRRHVRAA